MKRTDYNITETQASLQANPKNYCKLGNAGVVEERILSVDSPLHLGRKNVIYYVLKEAFVNELKQSIRRYYDRNCQNKEMEFSDDDVKNFLHHLQLVVNYPTGNKLNHALEDMIPSIEFAQGLEVKSCIEHVHKKVDAWYSQPRGIYLTPEDGRAFFCEVRNNLYCQMLKAYDITFQNVELPLKESTVRVLHIIPEKEYILNVVKVYQGLQEDISKVLFLSLDQERDIQKQVLDAFKVPYYTCLVIVCMKIPEAQSQEFCEEIITILSNNNYKKVILIAEEDSTFVDNLKKININVSTLKEEIKLSSLTDGSQKEIKRMKRIIFQGSLTSLNEFLPSLTIEELDDVVTPDVLVKLAMNQRVTVGCQVNFLDENMSYYYIPRTFKQEAANIPEEELYQWCENRNEKVILISDAPGMGKSTVLTSIALNLKKSCPSLWIIRFDINNYTDTLLKHQKRNSSIALEDLLNSEKRTRLSSDFEKKVFAIPKKVMLMIDGIDEISPRYKYIISNFLTGYKEMSNCAKIIVTTRPHLCEELEQQLQVKSWTMEPFSRASQINFLKNYWIKNLELIEDEKKEKCEAYAEALIKETSWWFKNTFAGIPLQARMLAEVFQEKGNNLEEWETCSEYLTSLNDKPNLPNHFDLVKLYETFIGKKYDNFVNYYRGNLRDYGKIYEMCKQYHRIEALKTILSEEHCKLFHSYKKKSEGIDEESALKLGIVQKTDSRTCFTHRTFAEYFVAKCLIKELKRGANDEQFHVLFVNEVLKEYHFSIVRAFLNCFLQRGMHNLPYNIFRDIGRQLIPITDIVLNTSGEGFVGILKFLFECLDAANVDFDINRLEERCKKAIHKAAAAGNLDTIRFLIERGAAVNARGADGCTALYLPVITNDIDMIRCLVENGADINLRDYDDCTALYLAAVMGSLDVVEYLVRNGGDVNVKNKYSDTALHMAASFASLDVVKCIIENGAEVNCKSKKGRTALHEACKWDKSDIAKYLVENGAEVDTKAENGITPLHEAASKGNTDAVKCLIENGAPVNSRDERGRTPLHEATNLEVVRTLLQNGAKSDIKDTRGYTALYESAMKGELDTVKRLFENGAEILGKTEDGRTVLHEAALWGRLDIVKFLVENGAEVNSRESDGCTPLFEAASRCHLDTIKYLIGHSAEVNARAEGNRTPLHMAAEIGNLDTVMYLVENGADINSKDEEHCTAFYVAVAKSGLDVIKYLIRCGSEVNSRCYDSYTPLHEAATRYNVEMVKYLVDNGAEINSTTKSGITPLHRAAIMGDLVTVKYLVENGIDINSKDEDDCTVLHMACGSGDLDTIRYLVENGIPVSSKTKDGYSILHAAAFKGDLEIVKYLIENDAEVNDVEEDGCTPLHEAAIQGRLDVVKYLVENGASINSKSKNGSTAIDAALRNQFYDVIDYLKEKRSFTYIFLDTVRWYFRKLPRLILFKN